MSRKAWPQLARLFGSRSLGWAGSPTSCASPQAGVAAWLSRSVQQSAAAAASPAATTSDVLAELPEHATGPEKVELEGKKKGVDVFHDAWLDAPWGTETAPVEVTSICSERIVGVPDPYDDSIVWWGKIKEGEGPRQLVPGGEYFTLKRLPGGDHHH